MYHIFCQKKKMILELLPFLFVFSWMPLRNLFIFSFRLSIIFIKAILSLFSCASIMLEYSGL